MKKKILFFILNLSGGGAERMLCDIVGYMNPEKYDITVQTFYDVGAYKHRLPAYVRYRTVVSRKADVIRKVNGRVLWQKMPKGYVYEKYIRQDYDYEVAFLEGLSTKLIADGIKDKKEGGPKRFAWVHADLFTYYYTGKFYGSVEEEAASYQKFDRVVCVSENAKDCFIKRYGDTANLCVKYNFIDRERILKMSREMPAHGLPQKAGGEFLIVTVGRLNVQKGYDRLLSAIHELHSGGMPCRLWIFGEGEERGALERYIKQNGMCEYVELFGFVDNPYCYIKEGDLFVCSSRGEGYGLAIAEAMLLGVPVVSTDCAGPAELLNHGEAGLIVENSKEGIRRGMVEMYESKEMRLKFQKAGMERVHFFEPSYRMSQIEELFEE